MPIIKQPLEKRLELMAEDIQIGGDVNFRSMALALIISRSATPKEAADMERLLSRANRLLKDLREFWNRHPRFENLVDRAEVAAHSAK